jgi:hypothetical protein
VLNLCAWLVRLRLLPSLAPFARMVHWTSNRLRWGEHRGGMHVEVRGLRDGEPVARSWHMIAEGDDGPFIPAMACAAIIRNCLAGQPPAAGARPATEDVALEDYERQFALRAIHSGTREASPAEVPLYRRLLGDAYETLPAPLQAMHDLTGRMEAEGIATVTRGASPLARLTAAIVGFPHAGANVPVRVDFTRERARERGRERWTRTFAGRSFDSTQEAGSGRNEWLVCERFGPVCIAMALVLDGARLRLVMRRWSLFGVPLPLWLAPRGNAYEHAADGRFNFHVEISHPFTGLIVGYRGWLVPQV